MQIPDQFKSILEKDQELLGIVNTTIARFEKIINESKFEFFSEYTNHGMKHIENVLKTAEWLIAESSFTQLGPNDVTVLILSVLLHDLGMHISHDGLMSLLQGSLKENRIRHFDDLSWDKDWEKYFAEAKLWNGKKIAAVFGKGIAVRIPPTDRDSLTEYDKKLYGEFIRRKHPRLAHEIAHYGFPGIDGNTIPFAEGLNQRLRDLTGLVARSHGLNIRDTFDYLKNGFGEMIWKNPSGVKVVFLMVILRIADYLHITSDRAYPIVLEGRKLSSPISQQEWKTHQAVEYVNEQTDDPELLYVQAMPQNSEIYLKLRDLLKDIQRELDLSWAILGEVYGSIKTLSELKIRVRRIKSNIDDQKWFGQNVSYLPEKIVFDADPELLKLLVAPLYGDNPSYGVRELLQNAVDACREREQLLINRYGEDSEEVRLYSPKVEVKIEGSDEKGYTFTITDNGIGMTKDTLIHYFFKAGASFRKSNAWGKQFADAEGNSKVQRSGRFGVGVLAGYLLGEEIHVTTRHVDSTEAFDFVAKLDSSQVEVSKVLGEIGTAIAIQLSKVAARELGNQPYVDIYSSFIHLNQYGRTPNWFDWYQLNKPTVTYTVPSDWEPIEPSHFLIKNSGYNGGWNRIFPDGYNSVDWSYNERNFLYGLFCNGVVIPQTFTLRDKFAYPSFYTVPVVSISDYNGNLPLSLSRNNLDENRLPFEEELAKDICRDILAKLLLMQNPAKFHSSYIGYYAIKGRLSHPAFGNDAQEGELIFFREGYCLAHPYSINNLPVNKLMVIYFLAQNGTEIDFSNLTLMNEGIGLIIGGKYEGSGINEMRNLFYRKRLRVINKEFDVSNRRFFITSWDYSHYFREGGLRKDFRSMVSVENLGDEWVCVTLGNPNPSMVEVDELDEYDHQVGLIVEYDITHQYDEESPMKDIFSEIVSEFLGDDVVIPYDLEERKRKFPKAFKELNKYMIKYQGISHVRG